MDWIKSIIEKHIGEDGKLDLEATLKEINKKAPENVVPKDQYNSLSESNKQLKADVQTRDTQLEELKKELANLGEKPYRAEQIFKWLYQDKVKEFDEMTNLSLQLREKLKEIGIENLIETKRGQGYKI